MATNKSKIEWTDRTWNPVRGCSRVSPGCDNCYAMGQAHRYAGPGRPFEGLTTIRSRKIKGDEEGKERVDWSGEVRFIPEQLRTPLSWTVPKKNFVNSMSDLFHESLTNEQIAAVFGVMAACPTQIFQVLTKRGKRMRKWFEWVDTEAQRHGWERVRVCFVAASRVLGDEWRARSHPVSWPLPNVWLGVSGENQHYADVRWEELAQVDAAVKFISMEPLLGPITMKSWATLPDWIILGGESGNGHRPPRVAWFLDLVEEGKQLDVPCFVKQLGKTLVEDVDLKGDWGQWVRFGEDDERYVKPSHSKGGDMDEWPEVLRVRQWPKVYTERT